MASPCDNHILIYLPVTANISSRFRWIFGNIMSNGPMHDSFTIKGFSIWIFIKMSIENINACGAYLLSRFILIETQKAVLH